MLSFLVSRNLFSLTNSLKNSASILCVLLVLVLFNSCRSEKAPPREAADQGLTFMVGSDLHFGNGDSTAIKNSATAEDMISTSSSQFPDALGGGDIIPEFVVFTGDLTDNGQLDQWEEFESMYEINGKGEFPIPVYEGFGNHDGPIDESIRSPVRDGIKNRNMNRQGLTRISPDSLHYSWDLNEFHFVNLNSYPGNEWDSSCDWCHYFKDGFREPSYSLDFLKDDLEKSVGNSSRPIVLFFHYGFDEWGDKWWTKEEQEAFYEVVKEYNIAAIFHGHTHGFDYYKWHDIPVWCVGATQHENGKGQYLTVHLKDEDIFVLERIGNQWGTLYQDSYTKSTK